MSLWGEYKAGLISDSEYTRLAKEEYLRDSAEAEDWDEEEVFEDDEIDEW